MRVARLGTGREKKGKGNVNAGKFETAVEVSWVLELGRGDSKPAGFGFFFLAVGPTDSGMGARWPPGLPFGRHD